ncbi:hypothetical protein IFM89_009212 [Coptis chinensis]|uniref:Uncharacterized protein n=1 Tax=Coptis chinensis TaxID=261450 RepID=A0A835IV88_9MAGN|nr:hypothetical protein IFM89_009212 [Coptis chinensis]
MKKKLENEEEQEHEILKAVAQAWLAHSGSSGSTNEFDAYRSNFRSKPTRFKTEAMRKLSTEAAGSNWNFRESLWDSYEIVAVAKRLETGMVLDHPLSLTEESNGALKKHKESKNSLRKLFHTSKRFSGDLR